LRALVVTAIATTCAARYTYKQWLTADDTEKRSLRAYVFVESGAPGFADKTAYDLALERGRGFL